MFLLPIKVLKKFFKYNILNKNKVVKNNIKIILTYLILLCIFIVLLIIRKEV